MPISPRLYHAIETCIMERMPIRVLKVPEIYLMDRSAILAYLKDKLCEYDDGFIAEATTSQQTSEEQFIDKTASLETRYIVLSHTWLTNEPEVLYADTVVSQSGSRQIREGMNGVGFRKLTQFCNVVSATFLTEFAWMDTICINKVDYSELQESISSMFKWYAQSSACVVYLAATTSYEDMDSDRWFTRGWTLQELVAPSYLVFYTKSWTPLGECDIARKSVDELEKTKIMSIITRVTNISATELHGFTPGFEEGLAARMMWLQHRQTTKPEDIVYSILGIFGVCMRVDYGEGKENAFFRFLETILSRPGRYPHSLSILNWAGGLPIGNDIHPSNILPSGPECYLRHNVELNESTKLVPQYPLALNASHNGVRISLLLVFAYPKGGKINLEETGPIEFGIVQNKRDEHKIWKNAVHVHLLDDSPIGRTKLRSSNLFVFGVWSFKTNSKNIILPQTCSAFLFAMTVNQKDAPFSAVTTPSVKDYVCAESKVNTQEVVILETTKPGGQMRLGIATAAKNYNLLFLKKHYI